MDYERLIGNIYTLALRSDDYENFARAVWRLDPSLEMENKELSSKAAGMVERDHKVLKTTSIANTLVAHCDKNTKLTSIIEEAAEVNDVEPKNLQNADLKKFVRD